MESYKQHLMVAFLILISVSGCTSTPIQKKFEHFDWCSVKAISQRRSDSCGSACMVAVLTYWGLTVTEKEVLLEFPPLPEGGYSIAQLKSIATVKGLESYALTMLPNPRRMIREQIMKGRPVICAVRLPTDLYFAHDVPLIGTIYRWWSWNKSYRKNHFIVVIGTNINDEFLFMDSAFGYATLSWKHLRDCWGKRDFAALLCVKKIEQN